MDDDEPVGPMTFGRHRGRPVDELSSDYLRWVLRNIPIRSARLRGDIEYVLISRGYSYDEIEGV